MRITVRHRIEVKVGEGNPRAVQHLLLTPLPSRLQTVAEWRIEAPGMDDATGFIDAFGNRAHLSSQTVPEARFAIEASGVVETHDRNGVVGRLDRDPVPSLFRRVTPLTKPVGAVTSRFRSAPREGKDRIALFHALMTRVGEVLGEQAEAQSQSQSQSQDGAGQSQGQSQDAEAVAEAADFAHLFIGALRALDVPARYVTGYLAPADGDTLSGLHAWAEAWDDSLGWIAFDPMLNLCPGERHVRLASGLDAVSAVPVRSVPAIEPPDSTEVDVSAD